MNLTDNVFNFHSDPTERRIIFESFCNQYRHTIYNKLSADHLIDRVNVWTIPSNFLAATIIKGAGLGSNLDVLNPKQELLAVRSIGMEKQYRRFVADLVTRKLTRG